MLTKKYKLLVAGFNEQAIHLKELGNIFRDMIQIIGYIDPQAENAAFQEKEGELVYGSLPVALAAEKPDVLANTTAEKLTGKGLPCFVLEGKGLDFFLDFAMAYRTFMLQVEELKANREKLNAVFNSAREAIEVTDKEGRITFVNKAFTEVTKITPDQRLGKNIFEIYSQGALAEVHRSGQPVFGKVMVTDTGVDVICNASPMIVDGQMIGAVVVFQDISDVKRLSKKLDESRSFIDSLQKGINALAAAKYSFEDIIGESPEMINLKNLAKKVARSNTSTVLITGESGTGKELFAQAIHNQSRRQNKAFIGVNCAAIPENLLESELFGYEKGAFTGASSAKMGKFELANEGTIFLDEIGDMSLPLQAKLLRVLQEKEVLRLGGASPKRIDVQIIAATNCNLPEKIRTGLFRSDLYYRLNVIPIKIPPLRERKSDIRLLAQWILREKNQKFNKNCTFSVTAMEKLNRYDWPGNVRELSNVIERAVLLTEDPVIGPDLILIYSSERAARLLNQNINLMENEKDLVIQALRIHGLSVAGKKRAAGELNISLSTLYNKIKKYQINLR